MYSSPNSSLPKEPSILSNLDANTRLKDKNGDQASALSIREGKLGGGVSWKDFSPIEKVTDVIGKSREERRVKQVERGKKGKGG